MTTQYYIFRPKLTIKAGKEIFATLESNHADYKIQQQLNQPIPIVDMPIFTFTANLPKSDLDFLWTGTYFQLMSKRLIDILALFQVKHCIYALKMINLSNGDSLNNVYSIFHLLEVQDYIDWQKSDIPKDSIKFNRIVLTEDCLKREEPMFRLKGVGDIVLVHKNLKSAILKEKISGCEFLALEDFRTWEGIDTRPVDKLLKQYNNYARKKVI